MKLWCNKLKKSILHHIFDFILEFCHRTDSLCFFRIRVIWLIFCIQIRSKQLDSDQIFKPLFNNFDREIGGNRS